MYPNTGVASQGALSNQQVQKNLIKGKRNEIYQDPLNPTTQTTLEVSECYIKHESESGNLKNILLDRMQEKNLNFWKRTKSR